VLSGVERAVLSPDNAGVVGSWTEDVDVNAKSQLDARLYGHTSDGPDTYETPMMFEIVLETRHARIKRIERSMNFPRQIIWRYSVEAGR
jgi:hypothetical protein